MRSLPLFEIIVFCGYTSEQTGESTKRLSMSPKMWSLSTINHQHEHCNLTLLHSNFIFLFRLNTFQIFTSIFNHYWLLIFIFYSIYLYSSCVCCILILLIWAMIIFVFWCLVFSMLLCVHDLRCRTIFFKALPTSRKKSQRREVRATRLAHVDLY